MRDVRDAAQCARPPTRRISSTCAQTCPSMSSVRRSGSAPAPVPKRVVTDAFFIASGREHRACGTGAPHLARLKSTYWRAVPGCWTHGDLVQEDHEGHFFVLGRSDDTLKVAGKRLAPAALPLIH